MPVFKDEIDAEPLAPQPVVKVRVRPEGHGRISTGNHDRRHGEEYYKEGEEFETTLDIAKALVGDPMSPIVHERRYYVDILDEKGNALPSQARKPVKAKD